MMFGLLLVVGLVISVLLLVFSTSRHPLTLQLIGATNDSRGNHYAYFCLSNSSGKEIVYLGDGTSLPYYHLIERRTLDASNRIFLATNHNLNQFFAAKQAKLPRDSSISFPVHVPSGVTGAVLQLSYLRPTGSLQESVRNLINVFSGGSSSKAYQAIEVKHPFENELKPLDQNLINFSASSSNHNRSGPPGVPGNSEPATKAVSSSQATNFIRVAVIERKALERVRQLLINARIEVVIGQASINDGSFPAGSYFVSVPQAAKPQADSLLRTDASAGKYWIQMRKAWDTPPP